MTKARDLASSGVTLTSTTTTADAALARAGGTMTGDLAMGTNLVDGVDVSARDAVLTSTTTLASAALPKSGGAMTGAITTNSTFDGVDIATRDAVLSSTTTTATNALNNANNALPKEGGAMTGPITTNSTFDGVDVGSRDSVLTSTTTTANAALPKTGGAMTGAITTNSTFDGVDIATRDAVLTATTTTANAALPKAGGDVTGLLKLSSIDPILRFNDTNGGTDTKNFEMRYVGTSSPDIDGLYFRTANDALNSYSDKMAILGSGNVGIGTSAPARPLNIVNDAGSNPIQSIRNPNTAWSQYALTRYGAEGEDVRYMDFGYYRGSSEPTRGLVIKSQSNSTLVTFLDSGNVGIGVSPSQKLHVEGAGNQFILLNNSTTNDGFYFKAGAGASSIQTNAGSHVMNFFTSGTERMRILANGNVLFHKQSTDGGAVGVQITTSGALAATRAGGAPIYFRRNTNIGDIAQFNYAGTTVGSVGVNSNSYAYITNTQSGGGGVSFGTGSALIPVDNTGAFAGSAKDIGASSVPFRDLYLSGGVRFDATGEFLDDYEEGTWTPYLARWTGGAITASYSSVGRYTKIGRMVTLSFDINVSSISSQGSSIAYIGGAPYNNNASHNYYYTGTFGIRTVIPEATIATSCIKHSTNNSILIRQNNDFDENVDDNWQVGIMRGSITYEHG